MLGRPLSQSHAANQTTARMKGEAPRLLQAPNRRAGVRGRGHGAALPGAGDTEVLALSEQEVNPGVLPHILPSPCLYPPHGGSAPLPT